MLFICLLTFTFPLQQWRKLVMLITAFTLGHSLTLALSVLNLVSIRQEYIELLIILTILVTAAIQLLRKNTPKGVMMIYAIICCFGLIHGMGFSYLLKSMMGKNENIVQPLLWFNLGLEAGQLIFVSLIVIISFLLNRIHKNMFRYFRTFVTVLVFVVSLGLLITRTLNLINA